MNPNDLNAMIRAALGTAAQPASCIVRMVLAIAPGMIGSPERLEWRRQHPPRAIRAELHAMTKRGELERTVQAVTRGRNGNLRGRVALFKIT